MTQSNKKRKKKPRLSTILVIVLMLIGLGVMLYPTARDALYRYQAAREIAQYNRVIEGTDTDFTALWEAAEEYNRQLAANAQALSSTNNDLADQIAEFLNPTGTGMMGYIEIPAINVYIPIYQGTEESALQAGAGYWLGTSLPTGGESTHCVLTAHNGLVKARMFTDIDQLVIGDTFTLTILDRTLTYEVDQILVVEPSDFSALEIVDGEDYVTLYTCTPYGINTHRLLVRGHRIEIEEETLADSSLPWLWIMLAVAVIVSIIALFVIKHRQKRKKQSVTSDMIKEERSDETNDSL